MESGKNLCTLITVQTTEDYDGFTDINTNPLYYKIKLSSTESLQEKQ